MLERVFGDAHVEELSRTFYCASVDLQASRLVIDRTGPLIEAVGASISLPLIAPPLRRGEELLIDGSLLDNLPVEPMSSTGEGPVLAIDIKAGHGRPRADVREEGLAEPNRPDPSLRSVERPHRKRLPSLPETMGRIALLSSANTAEAARRFADMTITVRVPTVGLTEFHQIDQARETGREIARAALEDAPGWLLGDDDDASPSTAGRRTVLRV
jgi:NTE family protein